MKQKFSIDDYKIIIEEMASQENVRSSVLGSYKNNPWCPNYVKDWRLRMIIAGLSTRVGFRMVKTYTNVITEFTKYSFEDIKGMPDKKLISIIKPLGMSNGRLIFIRSMIEFIENNNINIKTIDSDELVELIHKKVKGASYKVGACCVLYSKNYTCGVIPADSGTKDVLAPCIGLETKKSAKGHEIVRKQLECIANQIEWKEIIEKTGYSSLYSGKEEDLWWFHLVVINFKRNFCNNKKPEDCPLKRNPLIGSKIGCSCMKTCI